MNLLNLILDSQIIRLLVKLGSYLFDKLILALTTYFVAAEKFSIQKFFF